jgi:hypothetical protein
LAAIVVVGVYLHAEARNLWQEWVLLQGEVQESHRQAFVGYVDIAPNTTYAEPPPRWVHNEGEQTLIWSGWRSGVGHQWYRFPRGEIDPARISRPGSAVISRAIDYPLTETRGGQIWQRIPSNAVVGGQTLEGERCVYPFTVLSKVLVVNDLVKGRPFLIVTNPVAPEDEASSVFDADLGGRRVTFSATGYFMDGKPLLVDRGTESLWLEEQTGLRAVAGKLKNTPLARIARLLPISWSTWLSQNSQSRLLVGADRSRGIPKE